MAAERSGVSTNFGDMGNAHSEYLSNLVESGIPAMLLFIAILIMAFRKGLMIWYKSDDLSVKYLSMALMTALLSYAFHGGLNNFLDTDKIAGPFWIYIASLTTMKTGSGTPSS